MPKINRITVDVSDEMGIPSMVSLYKNNTRIAEVNTQQLEIPDFITSGTERRVYQQYCKDLIINLLQNGGIEGLTYEEKVQTDDGQAKKYGKQTFRQIAADKIKDILSVIADGTSLKYTISTYMDDADHTTVTDRYKDNNVKFGSTDFNVTLSDGDKSIQVNIVVEIRSGQICKPKKFTTDNTEHSLNVTEVMRLFR